MDEDRDLEKEFEAYLEKSLSSEDAQVNSKSSISGMEDEDDLFPGLGRRDKFLKPSINPKLENKGFYESTSLDVTSESQREEIQTGEANETIYEPGEDTLEEKSDKERFFKALKGDRGSPSNYEQYMNSDLPERVSSEDVLQVSTDRETDKAHHEHESGINSGSSSERKSRILEAINKRSMDFSTLDSLEMNKMPEEKETSPREVNVEPTNLSLDIKEADYGHEIAPFNTKGDLPVLEPVPESPVSHEEFSVSAHKDEIQRINEDYFELKHITKQVDSSPKINDGPQEDESLKRKLVEMEIELKHQEALLSGYQKENEKLYMESKSSQRKVLNSYHVHEENIKLRSNVANLKEELENLKSQNRKVDDVTQHQSNVETALSQRVEQLESELEIAQKKNSDLREEMHLMKVKPREKPEAPNDRNRGTFKKSSIPTLRSTGADRLEGARKKNDDHHHLVEYLENKVKSLEEELKQRTNDGDERLKSLERNFLNVKTQYQEHLEQLEEQLEKKHSDDNIPVGGPCRDPACRAEMIQLEATIEKLKDKLNNVKGNDQIGQTEQNVGPLKHFGMRNLESDELQKQIRENFELQTQIFSLRTKYESDIKMLHMEHSSKQSAQEVLIRQLKENLKESNIKVENLATMMKNHNQLQIEVARLKDNLKEAKRFHSPEMRHLEVVKEKIHEMQAGLVIRDQSLNELLRWSSTSKLDNAQGLMISESRYREERDSWRRLVLEKVNEIDHFRQQLDLVLEFMKKLKIFGTPDMAELALLTAGLNNSSLKTFD